jgi:sulfur-oxidizing protein SoxY
MWFAGTNLPFFLRRPVSIGCLINALILIFLVKENSTPLVASFNLFGAVGFISTRVKMGKTSAVDALVTAGGSTTKVTKEVKVTIGGCGG